MQLLPIFVGALLSYGFGGGRKILSINGGENRYDVEMSNPSYGGGPNVSPAYVVTKFAFTGGEERWVGFFCNNLAEAVKDNPAAYSHAETARNLSIANTVLLLPVVPLFFLGIKEINASTETASGKHDISRASTGSMVMLGSALGCFIASGVLFAIGKSEIRNVAKAWNENLKLGVDFSMGEGLAATLDIGTKLRYDF
jgi:hypothetical protein